MPVYCFSTCHVLNRTLICAGNSLIGLLLVLTQSNSGQAADFVIDEDLSSIRIATGTTIGSSVTVGPQASDASGDSLENNLSGTLSASVSGSTLTFNGSSVIDVVQHRLNPFLPTAALTGSGAVEDNFGAEALLFGSFYQGDLALRDVLATITTGSLAIGSPGSSLIFSVYQGTLDYDITLITDPGFVDLGASLLPTLNTSTEPVTGSVDGTINLPFYVDIIFSPPDLPEAENSHLVLEGLVVATRTGGLSGDFNGDGKVDGTDFLEWQQGLGTIYDATDLADWELNYGAPLAATSTTVPEPNSLALLSFGGLLALRSFRSATAFAA